MLGRMLLRRRYTGLGQPNTHFPGRAGRLNRVLERERARADRGGRELSLLLIGLDGRTPKGVGVQVLIGAIEKRCRITDEAGAFDGKTAFALLPETTTAGARRVAESVQHALSRQGVKTSFAIYTYTPKNNSDQNPPGSGGGFGEAQAGPVARRLPDPSATKKPAASVALTPERRHYELDHAMVRKLPAWKRVMDIVVAGGMLVVLWPVLVTIGLLVKLESRGPAIFRQQRAGLGNRPFAIYKFRTMRHGAEQERDALLHINEQDGPAFKIRNDPRVTKLGAFLRKTSLDELPQLLNVLRGEMTLVGPRPLPCHEADGCVGWQRRRLEVTPGLTCIWQVSGRSSVSFDDWVRMDLAYKKRVSLWQDVRILLATVPAVLTQRGAQ